MRIGIVGAGAIGGWLGVRLAAAGHRVGVIARGETLAALSSAPWRLQAGDGTLEAQVTASENPAALGVQDLVILALKGPALPGLADGIGRLIGPDTIVIPAMNGVPWWFLLDGAGDLGPMPLRSVDPDGAIAGAIPFEQVLGSVVHCSAFVERPGTVVLKAGNRLILGPPRGGEDARFDEVARVLAGAGLDIEASRRIRYDIWYKLWGNMTMNPISAISGATCDRILDDPLVSDFILSVMAEAQAIGARIDVPIAERGEDRNAVTRKLGAFRTSMLQDAEGGRALEIDQLLSAPREIASHLGLATPSIDALLGITRLFARERGLYPADAAINPALAA